jgi:predicted transcriptional regulator
LTSTERWQLRSPSGSITAKEGTVEQRRRKARRPERRPRAHGTPQEVLARALDHPIRAKALTIMSQRVASPREISEQIEAPLSTVSYHVRVLDDLGLIEAVEEEPDRGSVAHFYRAAIGL